jgi:RND family efflux transporter MFP subunit
MPRAKSIAAVAASTLILLGAVAAQSGGAPSPYDGQEQGQGQAQAPGQGVQALVLPDVAHLNWLERSSVAALREGVIEKMELKNGMTVKAGGTIGYLHRRFAELTIAKAQAQADSVGPVEKAQAQEEVAASVVARNRRLIAIKPGMVSAEDIAKAEGEMKAATATIKEATENRKIAQAELDLAVQTFEEHIIRAPFDGIVTKRIKEPGESVRAGDAVVEIGNLNRLAADGWVPIEYSYRVKVGQVVEIQPRTRSRAPLAIEKKRFRGKVTFVDPEIQPEVERSVRIRAEFENPGWELRPGLDVQMTIFLAQDAAAAAPPQQGDAAVRTAGNR